jgi:hypothetical protein
MACQKARVEARSKDEGALNAHVGDSEFSGLLLSLLLLATFKTGGGEALSAAMSMQRLQPLSGYCGLAKVDWSIK